MSINGERVALLDVDWKISETDKNGLNLQTFTYKGRDRFLIPASLAHGLLIEMVE